MDPIAFDFDIDHYLNHIIPRSRLYLLPKPISRFLGYRSSPPPRIGACVIWFWSFLGAFLGVLLVEVVYRTTALQYDGTPLTISSLGATAILAYNAIDSPLAQPRNALLGQTFAAIIGVSITRIFQLHSNFESLRWVAGALSVGIASAVMGMAKTVHPPAGATALLAATSPEITELGWFLVPLIMLGALLMLALACILNNIQRQFPIYWWTPANLSRHKMEDIEGNREMSYDDFILVSTSQIIIEKHNIVMPDWVSLEPEQRIMLEVLRLKLEQGVRRTSTTSDNTRVVDS